MQANPPRDALWAAIGAAALGAAYLTSPVAFAVTAGLLTAAAIFRLRYRHEAEAPERVDGAPLMAAARRLEEGRAEGGVVHAQFEGTDVRLDAAIVSGRAGMRVPVIRARILVNRAIPFCFLVRRREGALQRGALVRNTPIVGTSFEYELRGAPWPDPTDTRFEAASNYPRLLARLLDDGLAAAVDTADAHDLRLEALTYNGAVLTALFQPAGDPRVDLPLARAIDLTGPALLALAHFVEEQALVEAVEAAG